MKILILNGFILYKSLSQFQGPREMVLNEAHFKITVVDFSGGTEEWIRIYLPRRKHRFNLWFRKIPHATGAKGHAPKLLSRCCSAHTACGLHLLKPMGLELVLHTGEATSMRSLCTTTKRSPWSPQLEGACKQQ